ncbi:hypothetical protein BLD44_015565 [Mastigocladus laminosus UU774]|nr:hypothetical protein BLD44_015565 [Mastigocladus laminosus UU774]
MAEFLLILLNLYFFGKGTGRKMIYGKMPMMIFILASGYLFSIYLLLALAKRTGNKTTSNGVSSGNKGNHTQEVSVTPNVTEVSSVR